MMICYSMRLANSLRLYESVDTGQILMVEHTSSKSLAWLVLQPLLSRLS